MTHTGKEIRLKDGETGVMIGTEGGLNDIYIQGERWRESKPPSQKCKYGARGDDVVRLT